MTSEWWLQTPGVPNTSVGSLQPLLQETTLQSRARWPVENNCSQTGSHLLGGDRRGLKFVLLASAAPFRCSLRSAIHQRTRILLISCFHSVLDAERLNYVLRHYSIQVSAIKTSPDVRFFETSDITWPRLFALGGGSAMPRSWRGPLGSLSLSPRGAFLL